MRCKFKILVFQDGRLDERVETEVHEFTDGVELGNEMAKFAAMNVGVHHSALTGMESTRIQEPRIGKGLGPTTNLVIQEVVPVG